MQERVEVLAAWERALQHPLYMVAYDATSHPYVETPEEQGLSYGQPSEYVIRAFSSEEEACMYLVGLETYVDDKLVIVEVPWTALLGQVPNGLPVSVALSHIKPGEWPRTVDVIWTSYTQVH